jgi:hypothetical protein
MFWPRIYLYDLLHGGCLGGRARIFLSPNTSPLLGIVLLALVTLLAFSFLNSFVGV